MFSALVWGTVADVPGALSTGDAAVSALTYYILDSRKSHAAQARLVRASLHPEPNDIFEVSVTNDSDRPISLELLFFSEKNFSKALLADEVITAAVPADAWCTISSTHGIVEAAAEPIGHSNHAA